MKRTRPTAAERNRWEADLLPGFERRTIPLPEAQFAPDESGDPLVATLMRPAEQVNSDVAVVYIHGFNDYFFHTHVADFFRARGLGFYAVDLRRCGRSWRPGHYRSYVASIGDYADEIAAACAQAHDDGFDRVVLYGHSTGGLAVSLYADRSDADVAGLILNSPFFALPGPARVSSVIPMVRRVAQRNPERLFPAVDPGLYARSVHTSFGADWDYDLDLKPNPSERVRFGWLAAVIEGQAQVQRGLHVEAPVLCLTAARSSLRRTWSDDCLRMDIVLDQKRCGAAATNLGPDVSVVRIHDGIHDLALSGAEARGRFFTAIEHWLPYAGLVGAE